MKSYREINRKRKRLQRRGECCCLRNKLWKCDGDCDRCRYRVPDSLLLHLQVPFKRDENITLMDKVAGGAGLLEDIIADGQESPDGFKHREIFLKNFRPYCPKVSSGVIEGAEKLPGKEDAPMSNQRGIEATGREDHPSHADRQRGGRTHGKGH